MLQSIIILRNHLKLGFFLIDISYDFALFYVFKINKILSNKEKGVFEY